MMFDADVSPLIRAAETRQLWPGPWAITHKATTPDTRINIKIDIIQGRMIRNNVTNNTALS